MPIGFGDTFYEIEEEFWPDEVTQIMNRARAVFEARPEDEEMAAAQIQVSILPFEELEYGFVLVLRRKVWWLEVASFPPHAQAGQRVRTARRLRERKERAERRDHDRQVKTNAKATKKAKLKQATVTPSKKATKKGKRAKKEDGDKRIVCALNQIFQATISMLYNIGLPTYEKLKQLRPKLASFLDQIKAALPAAPLTVRQQLLRWIVPSHQECRTANIAAWMQDRLPRGSQRERRLFFADFLPIWLDTIAPIDSIFVRGGQSIFGEHFLESECVS